MSVQIICGGPPSFFQVCESLFLCWLYMFSSAFRFFIYVEWKLWKHLSEENNWVVWTFWILRVLKNYVSDSHVIISQMGPMELINLQAGEMGQLLHYKTFTQTFPCAEACIDLFSVIILFELYNAVKIRLKTAPDTRDRWLCLDHCLSFSKWLWNLQFCVDISWYDVKKKCRSLENIDFSLLCLVAICFCQSKPSVLN